MDFTLKIEDTFNISCGLGRSIPGPLAPVQASGKSNKWLSLAVFTDIRILAGGRKK
jgi:hypothetical protein